MEFMMAIKCPEAYKRFGNKHKRCYANGKPEYFELFYH